MRLNGAVITLVSAVIGFAPLLEARSIGHGDAQTGSAPSTGTSNPPSTLQPNVNPIIQAARDPNQYVNDTIQDVAEGEVSTGAKDDAKKTVVAVKVMNWGDKNKKENKWLVGKLKDLVAPKLRSAMTNDLEQWKRYSYDHRPTSSAIKYYSAEDCPRYLDKESDDYSDWNVKLYSTPQSFITGPSGKQGLGYDTEHVFEGQTLGLFLEFLMENTFDGMEEAVRDPHEPLDWTLGWQEPEGTTGELGPKKTIWDLDLIKSWFYMAPFKPGTPLVGPEILGPHTNQSFLEPMQQMMNSLASDFNIKGFTIFEKYANIMKGKLFGGMVPYILVGSAAAWFKTYTPNTKLSKIQEVGFTFDYMNKYADKFALVANRIYDMFKEYDKDWEPFVKDLAMQLPAGTLPKPVYDPRNSLSAKWKRFLIYTLRSIEVRCEKWIDAAAVEILNAKHLHGPSAQYGDQLEAITKEVEKMFTLKYKPSHDDHVVESAALRPTYRKKLKLDEVLKALE